VGWDVFEKECMEYSSLLVEKAIKIEGIKNGDLVIHSDNGGPMKGATMLATMQKLGVIPSFSRPSVSDDNPYSESLFRTLKYCPEFPKRPFCSLIESKNWVNKFVDWYNHKL
jgi:transposase InsO family protein